ncbi:MAG: hypothetical protein ACK4F0_06845 [Candidatus Ratteibacteria bacterium]
MVKKKERVLFEEIDPLKRKIKLKEGAFRHIKKCHPIEAIFTEKMKETIKYPISIWEDVNVEEEKKVWYYFNEITPDELDLMAIEKPYIMVVVKKIENEFRIVTCYVCQNVGKKGAIEIWKRK